MLDAVNLVKLPADTLDQPPRERSNPFAKWREGMQGDYHTMLIELWAYLADILTFYQERIANEAFLSTATQRDSLRRLAELIAYQPQPGSAATALLAFTIQRDQQVIIPKGFRTGSKPKPGKKPTVFETEAGIAARDEHSAIPLSMVAPTNQFALLSDYGLLLGVGSFAMTAAAAASVYGSAGATYLQTLSPALNLSALSTTLTETVAEAASPASSATAITDPLPAARAFRISESASLSINRSAFGGLYLSQTKRQIVLQGTSTRLAVGDYVLVVEHEGKGAEEKATVRQVSNVSPDKKSATTTITWQEPSAVSYDKDSTLYALRVTAAPFGSNAPRYNTLPADVKTKPPEDGDWDDASNAKAYVPAGRSIFLDSTYDNAKGTNDNPGWVVLLSDNASGVFHVTDARPVSNADYAMSTKVTRLTFKSPETIVAKIFPLRTTVVLTGNELLALQNNLPLPEPLSGPTLILAGQYSGLTAGQTVILEGKLYDSKKDEATEIVNAEAGILAGPPIVDTINNITTVTLKKALENSYARAGTVLYANIIEATQGETVRDEILGSSNGTAFQSFKLKKSPLTYLPADDAEGLSAVESTLLVTINGVLWEEKRTLFESAPNGQDYTASQDDEEKTLVTFGDGIFGARPPTGKDNVHARYRKGLGNSGNVGSGDIQQLIDSLPGVQKVKNPQAAFGGADREDSDQVRTNASASLRTFGRAVSAADYAALALSYPGVAKASAAWVTRDATTLKALAHPYIQLVIATADQKPLAVQPTFALKLRGFLDQRRDPNVPLRITDFVPVYIDASATVEIDEHFPQQATLAAVQAALNPAVSVDGPAGFFAFERLGFGESVHLSALYAELQSVAGVRDARVTTLRRLDTDSGTNIVRDSLFIRPVELAVINNNPDKPGEGTLSITGTGGFIDT